MADKRQHIRVEDPTFSGTEQKCFERDQLIRQFENCAWHLEDLVHRSVMLNDEAFSRAMERIEEWKHACDAALRVLKEHRMNHGC